MLIVQVVAKIATKILRRYAVEGAYRVLSDKQTAENKLKVV